MPVRGTREWDARVESNVDRCMKPARLFKLDARIFACRALRSLLRCAMLTACCPFCFSSSSSPSSSSLS